MSKQWIPNSSSIKRETWKPTSSWSPATATHSQPAAPQAGPSTSKRPRSPRRRSYSPDPPSRPAQTGSTGRSDANDIQSDDRGSRSYRPDDKGFKKDDKEERSWSAWNSKVGRDDRERERRGVSPERVRGRERERERDRDRSRSRSRSMDREKDKEVGRSGPRDSGGRRDISGRAKENGWRKGVKDEGRSWSAWNSRVEGLKKEDDRSIDKRNEKIGQSYRPAPDRTPSPPLKVKRDRSPDHGAVRYRRESPDYGVGGRGRGRRDSPDYAKGSVEMRERSQDRDPQSSSSRRQRSPTPPSKGVADRKRDPPSPRLSEAKRPRDTSPARSHVSSRQRSRSRSRNRRRSPSKSPPPPSRPVADRWRLPKDRDREQEREKPLSPPHSQRHWSPNRTTEPSDSPTKSTLASQFEMFRSEAQVWRRDPVEESVPGNRNQSGSTASQDHPSAFQARSSWESRRAEPNGNLPGWNRPQPDQTSRQRVWGQPGPASVPNGQHNLSASQSPSMSVNGYSRQSGSATSSQLDHGRVHTDTFERSSSPVKAGWKKIAAPSNPTFQSPDTRDLLVETKRFDSDVSGEAEMEIDEPQSTDSWSGAVKADQVRKDTTAATEAQYSAHLSTIAPYIQAAFTQWYAQNAEPGLSQFLVHYFGRAPDQKELSQIEQLLTLRREINRNQQGGQTNGTPSHVTPIAEKGRTILTDQHDINGSASTPSQASVLGPSTTSPADSQPSRPSKAASGSATETYERLICVGEGTYGKVYKARDNETREIVALKRIRMEGEKDGFPVTAMREIKLLQGLRHENVIRLNEMMVSKGSVYMVFEYMDHDLTGLLSHPTVTLSPANIKSLNYQMLSGLGYLHDCAILHRDMKGSNILLSAKGELKLADFGLARLYNKKRRNDYTNRVITLWYRSPELLLGETVYGPEVDMWSAGCIMLELFLKKPVFQGNDEIHQLEVIYSIMGTPSETNWPAVKGLPWYELVKPKEDLPSKFREMFTKWLSPAGLDLAEGLLFLHPGRRFSAHDAKKTEYFASEEPKMERPQLSGFGEHHEMSAKAERQRLRLDGK